MMYDYLLQEWTLQSTDGQPVTLTFNSFDVEAMPLPVTSPLTSYIWSPNYPNAYDSNYQQVREALEYSRMQIIQGPSLTNVSSFTNASLVMLMMYDDLHIVGVDTTVYRWSACNPHLQ